MTEATPTKAPRARATTRSKTAPQAPTQTRAASDEPTAATPREHDAALAPEPWTATAAEDTAANPGPSLGADAAPAPASARLTKGARLLEMLATPEGATLASLGQALAWQAHTLRAALTRLRQAGHAVERSKSSEGETVYRLTPRQPDGAPGTQLVEQTEAMPEATATLGANVNPVAASETASPAPRAPEVSDGGVA